MQERILKVEQLRILAMMAVVVNHMNICALNQFDYSNAMVSAYISEFLHSAACIGVPVFFLISGYLMLDDKYEVTLKKLGRQILRYCLVIVIYGTIFAWIELVFNDGGIAISQLPSALYAMFTANTWDHMWFLYDYVGMLLILPILKIFWKYANREFKYFVIIVGIIFTAILSKLGCGIQVQLVSVYMFCFLFGGLLKDWEKEKKFYGIRERRGLSFGIVLDLIVLLVFTYFLIFFGFSALQDWVKGSSVFVVILAGIVATLFLNRNDNRVMEKPFVKLLSRCSFGIYIYHMLWINILYKVVKLDPYTHGVGYMLLCIIIGTIIILALSLATTWVTKLIPGLKKLI